MGKEEGKTQREGRRAAVTSWEALGSARCWRAALCQTPPQSLHWLSQNSGSRVISSNIANNSEG